MRGHHLVPASSSIIQSSRIHISSHLRNPENNFYCAIFSHGMGLAVFLYRSSLEVISPGSVTRNKNLTVQAKLSLLSDQNKTFPAFLAPYFGIIGKVYRIWQACPLIGQL